LKDFANENFIEQMKRTGNAIEKFEQHRVPLTLFFDAPVNRAAIILKMEWSEILQSAANLVRLHKEVERKLERWRSS
jgi:hypothetical protein